MSEARAGLEDSQGQGSSLCPELELHVASAVSGLVLTPGGGLVGNGCLQLLGFLSVLGAQRLPALCRSGTDGQQGRGLASPSCCLSCD